MSVPIFVFFVQPFLSRKEHLLQTIHLSGSSSQVELNIKTYLKPPRKLHGNFKGTPAIPPCPRRNIGLWTIMVPSKGRTSWMVGWQGERRCSEMYQHIGWLSLVAMELLFMEEIPNNHLEWLKSTKDDDYPLIFRFFYHSRWVAGFCPSTVSKEVSVIIVFWLSVLGLSSWCSVTSTLPSLIYTNYPPWN